MNKSFVFAIVIIIIIALIYNRMYMHVNIAQTLGVGAATKIVGVDATRVATNMEGAIATARETSASALTPALNANTATAAAATASATAASALVIENSRLARVAEDARVAEVARVARVAADAKVAEDAAAAALVAHDKAAGVAVSTADECTSWTAALWSTHGSEFGIRCCPGLNVVTVDGKTWCAELPLDAACNSNLQCSSGKCGTFNTCVISPDPSGQYASTYMNSSPTTFLGPGIIVYNPVTGSGTIDNGVSAGTLSRVMTEATGTRFMWVELSLRGTFDGTMMRWDNNSTWTARTAITVPLTGQYTIKGGRDGKFCADDANKMVCNRDTAGKWETFTIIQNGNGYNIRGGRDNKFCADEGNRIVCNRGTAGQWETFKINKKGDVYNLIGGKNNKLCADENGNIVCNRDAEGTWEQFKLIKL